MREGCLALWQTTSSGAGHTASRSPSPWGPSGYTTKALARLFSPTSHPDPARTGGGAKPSGSPPARKTPSREVPKRYRARLGALHPDHGGEAAKARKASLELNEARRILSGKPV